MIPHLVYITSWLGRPIIKFGKTDLDANAACSQCGGPIRCDVHKQGRLFCSVSCESKHYNSRRPKKEITAKRCAHCGAEFFAKRTDARYCSARCRQQVKRTTTGDSSSAGTDPAELD